jgi:hypothetical protein
MCYESIVCCKFEHVLWINCVCCKFEHVLWINCVCCKFEHVLWMDCVWVCNRQMGSARMLFFIVISDTTMYFGHCFTGSQWTLARHLQRNYYYFSFVFRSFWAKNSMTQRLLIMIKRFPINFLSSENFELHCARFLELHHQCNTLAI